MGEGLRFALVVQVKAYQPVKKGERERQKFHTVLKMLFLHVFTFHVFANTIPRFAAFESFTGLLQTGIVPWTERSEEKDLPQYFLAMPATFIT